MKKLAVLLLLSTLPLALLTGCATTLECVPLSGDALKDDNKNADAIPYYLPKPYLVITRNVNATGSKKTVTVKTDSTKDTETKTTVTEPVEIKGAAYSYEIIYLPDLRYKYGLKLHRGSGSYETSFTLENGWMFTGLKAQGDAKTPETIEAMGTLATKLASAAGTALVRGLEQDPAQVAETAGSVPKIWIYEVVVKTVGGKDVMAFEKVGEWTPGK